MFVGLLLVALDMFVGLLLAALDMFVGLLLAALICCWFASCCS